MCNLKTKTQKDAENKVEGFVQEFHKHGMGCGLEIAKVVKDIHPNAIAIVPLYRSCIVIEQTEKDKTEGVCGIHAYADPHWLGRDITAEELQSDDFHSKFMIQGLREGPEVVLEHANNYQKFNETISDIDLNTVKEEPTGDEQ